MAIRFIEGTNDGAHCEISGYGSYTGPHSGVRRPGFVSLYAAAGTREDSAAVHVFLTPNDAEELRQQLEEAIAVAAD